MTKLTYPTTPQSRNLYRKLEREVKAIGVKLIHAHRKYGWGAFYAAKGEIWVPNETRNTTYGCFILGHELKHAVDCLEGKFAKWFNNDFKDEDWISPRYIRRVEGSANNFARKVLKEHEVPTKGIQELTRRCFEEWCMPFSILRYNHFEREDIPQTIEELYKEINVVPFWNEKNPVIDYFVYHGNNLK